MSGRLGSLFTGAGGLDMGVAAVLDVEPAWHAEVDSAASKVLAHRWPDVPNLGDVTAVDWSSVEPLDVLCGGSPCQDVSHAGKRAGMRAGTRSGLWASMVDAIDVLRPSLVIWENVRGVLSAEADSALEPCAGCVGDGDDGPVLRALGRVLGDLAELGYDASWFGLRAADVGAPHGRFRVFVVAADTNDRRYTTGSTSGSTSRQPESPCDHEDAADAPDLGHKRGGITRGRWPGSADGGIAAADADSDALRKQPVTVAGRCGEAVAGFSRADAASDAAFERRRAARRYDGVRDAGLGASGIDWGVYGPAIRRWERVAGPAPSPTEVGPKGGRRLSPRFTEWMMGWPAGWVTDVPGVSRNDALKICGNGVVPQQAEAAIRWLLSSAAVAA